MLYSINWINFIAWLFSLLEILGNTCTAVVCSASCVITNFEINFIKPFFYMTKKSRQKFKYLENEKSFKGETRGIFQHFKELCLKLFQLPQFASDQRVHLWKIHFGPLPNNPSKRLSKENHCIQFKVFLML